MAIKNACYVILKVSENMSGCRGKLSGPERAIDSSLGTKISHLATREADAFLTDGEQDSFQASLRPTQRRTALVQGLSHIYVKCTLLRLLGCL